MHGGSVGVALEAKVLALQRPLGQHRVEVPETSFCAWCGAQIPPLDRFCSRCGRPIAGTYPPPRSSESLAVLVIIVLIVGVTIAVAGLLSTMTPGLYIPPITTSKPVVTLTATTTSSGADILVAGIQPTAAPSNFKVNIEDVSPMTFGTAMPMPTSPGGVVAVTVSTGGASTLFDVYWQNPGGSGQVSQGDHFAIIWISGPYVAGTIYAFLLIWSDGSTLTSVNWQV